MRRTVIAVLVTFAWLVAPRPANATDAAAGLRPGDSVLVRSSDGRELVGTVERTDAATLVLSVGAREATVAWSDIAEWHLFARTPAARRAPAPPLPFSPEIARKEHEALELSIAATAAGWLSLRLWESRSNAPLHDVAGAAAIVGIFVGPGVGLAYAGEPGRAAIGTMVRGLMALTAVVGLVVAALPCVATSSGASGSGSPSCGNDNVDGLYVAMGAAAAFAASTGYDFYEATRAPAREAAKHARVGVTPWFGRDRGGVLVALRF